MLLSVKTVAKELGLHEETIRRRIKSGGIKITKLGTGKNSIKISEEEVEWIKQNGFRGC